ncbi:MAG: hypothetical protein Q7S88_01305 [Candidatus Daviesbacteria bacterium]|nr:hypothetical protein [Candidatus Daviesbacteria bacterium]
MAVENKGKMTPHFHIEGIAVDSKGKRGVVISTHADNRADQRALDDFAKEQGFIRLETPERGSRRVIGGGAGVNWKTATSNWFPSGDAWKNQTTH